MAEVYAAKLYEIETKLLHITNMHPKQGICVDGKFLIRNLTRCESISDIQQEAKLSLA